MFAQAAPFMTGKSTPSTDKRQLIHRGGVRAHPGPPKCSVARTALGVQVPLWPIVARKKVVLSCAPRPCGALNRRGPHTPMNQDNCKMNQDNYKTTHRHF
eukprot:7386150-Prymnesium_polylepis.2